MYDKERVVKNMKAYLKTSRFPCTLKETGYCLSMLNNDYYQALLGAYARQHDEDDRLVYFIIVLEDILHSEYETLEFADIDQLHEETYDTFREILINEMNSKT